VKRGWALAGGGVRETGGFILVATFLGLFPWDDSTALVVEAETFLENACIYHPDVVLSGDEEVRTKQELTVSEGI